MSKLNVFLGDLVHTWNKVSVWTFPLSVGYIGAYALKQLSKEIEIKIFKDPDSLSRAIKSYNPDVVALSYYVWNANLNNHILELAKLQNPKSLTVGGGPIFTILNKSKHAAKKFFKTQKFCDSFVLNQGEKGFVELLRNFISNGRDVEKIKKKKVAGNITNDLEFGNKIQIGDELELIENLDEIPSPYLTGLLDPFFERPFSPIIETNRACPYRCSFCAWGVGTISAKLFY